MSCNVVVVSAKWCGQCGPYKESLKSNQIEFTELDADSDDNMALLQKYGIRSLPTTLIYRKGESDPALLIVGSKVNEVKEFLDNN